VIESPDLASICDPVDPAGEAVVGATSHVLALALRRDRARGKGTWGARPRVHWVRSLKDLDAAEMPGWRSGVHGDVAVWVGEARPDLDEHDHPVWSFFDSEDRRHIYGFVRPCDRRESLAAGFGMKVMLGAVLGIEPQGIAMRRDAAGKPRPMEHEGLHVSASHSRGVVAVAMAGVDVGVDVEACEDYEDLAEMAQASFSPRVAAEIASRASSPERTLLYYRHWALVEAYTKATGLGLAHDLNAIRFSSQGEPRLLECEPQHGPALEWAFALRWLPRPAATRLANEGAASNGPPAQRVP
jgi:4'-phosphopantetheinyl transferase